MARVKRGTTAHKRRKNVLQQTKGFRWGRKSKYRLAKDALAHAWQHAFADRRTKKGVFRRAWEVQINAASRAQGLSYSRLIHQMKLKDIQLDRKILSELAKTQPDTFKKVVESANA